MLIEVRGRVALILERVRVTGWPSGGHGSAIGVSGEAYIVARDCVFDAGGGRGQTVLSDRGATLSLFERCRFVDAHSVIRANLDYETRIVARFFDCTFERSRITSRAVRPDVRVRGGVARLEQVHDSIDRRLSAFGATHVTSVEGLEYEGAPAACTVADVLAALRAVPDHADRRAFAVYYRGKRARDSRRFHVSVAEEGQRVYVDVEIAGDGSFRVLATRDGGRDDDEDRGEYLPLLEIVERAALDPSLPLKELEMRRGRFNGERMTTVRVPDGSGHRTLNARTGEDALARR